MKLVLLLLFPVLVLAQGREIKKRDLAGAGDRYAKYFIILKWKADLPAEDFAKLFADNSVSVPNDFSDNLPTEFPPFVYYTRIKEVLLESKLVQDSKIEVGNSDNFLYGREGDLYYIYLFKSISYKYGGQQYRNLSFWERLDLKEITGKGLKIVAIHRLEGKPDADDHRIVIKSEIPPPKQATLPAIVKMIKAGEPMITVNVRKEALKQESLINRPAIQPGPPIEPKPRHHPDNPPYFRWALAVEGGAMNDAHMDPNAQTTATRSLNYTGAFSFRWNICAFISLSVGYQYLYLPLDAGKLDQQIKDYFQTNNAGYKGLSINSNGWQIHQVYSSLGFGSYNGNQVAWGVEGIFGVALVDSLFRSNLSVKVDYAFGDEQIKHYPLNLVKRFPIFGGKAWLALAPKPKSNWRFLISLFYLQGSSRDEPQQIRFGGLPGGVNLPALNLQSAGVSAGLQWNFHRP